MRRVQSNGIIFFVMATKKIAKSKNQPAVSIEYREYEKRYIELGNERPKLSPEEFEQYDDELLELLALDDDLMTDEQIVRIQELEYLLIDTE
ncbi:MAG: hypothetical protein B6D41_05615 [Chloroflexi bacterium UTCFX4]|nr:MAG: hypothetical protein B6D41_05615 [Chloroflexi bacterium UTCFX4]